MTGEEPNLPAEDDSVDSGYVEAVGEALRRREAGSLDPDAFRRDYPDHAEQILDELDIIDRLDPDTTLVEAVPIAPPAGIRDRRIGPYRLVDALGRGGQGHVYRAEDTRLGRTVALKLLPAWLAGSAAARLRFAREAEIASKLQHPGICTVYDVGEADGLPYIAMAYIDGRPLSAQIAAAVKEGSTSGARCVRLTDSQGDEASEAPSGRRGAGSDSSSGGDRRAVRNIVRLIEAVARALHVAHEHGLVHRDVKPANLVITRDGKPVLVDFGLARVDEEGGPTLTRTGDVVGTPAYLSPEQASGEPTRVDQRTDVYSLGVVLYECLTLETPFRAPTRQALYRAIQSQEPPDPRRRNRAIGRDLLAVLQTALEKDPARRYQSAEAFADDLRAVAEGRPVSVKPISATRRAVRWARRRPAPAALVVLLTVGVPAVTAIGGMVYANWDDYERGKREREERAVQRLVELGYLLGGSEGQAASAMDRYRAAIRAARGPLPIAVAGLVMGEGFLRGPRAALELLDQYAEEERAEPALSRVRAALMAAAGRSDEAEELMRRYGPPRSALGHFLMGISMKRRPSDDYWRDNHWKTRHYDSESAELAVGHFQRAILYAKNAPAIYFFELTLAAGAAQKDDLVRDLVTLVKERWPDSPAAWGYVSEALRPFDVEEAIAASRRGIEVDPESTEAHAALGRLLFEVGRADESLGPLRRAIELAPGNSSPRTNLSVALFSLERVEEALVEIRHARRLAPGDTVIVTKLANMLMTVGRLDEAIREVEQAIRELPPSASLYAHLAELYVMSDNPGKAVAMAEKAVDLDPGVVCYVALGRACNETGDLERAEEAFREAIRRDRDAPRVHLASTYVGRAQRESDPAARAAWLERAQRECEEGLRRHPRDTIALYALADIHAKQGQHEKAVAVYDRALEVSTQGVYGIRTVFHWGRGKHLRALGRFREALASFRAGRPGPFLPLHAGRQDFEKQIAACERAVLRKVLSAVRGAMEKGSAAESPEQASRWSEERTTAVAALLEILRGWREDLEAGWETPPRLRQMLEHLANHASLSYLRDPALASRVPEAERPALRDLQAEWKRVADRVASPGPAR